jgi:cephalosporin-C deacetylase-like acetyl esterase
MDGIAQQQLDRRERAISSIRTVDAAENRKRSVREKILKLMGGLPDYKGPLNPRITGRLDNGAFTIEKVIYESLPGFFITANVYTPKRPGRYPGILLQNGHTQEGKPELQRLAANLALKGFVVLSLDPIGQGEREQSYSRELERSAAGWSTNEHLQAETQSLLIGQSLARYFIWDGIRSLDYLTSRSDVDAARIGAVGCSGGGALTTYIGALDRRVKAVASACSTNSFRVMFGRPVPKGEFHAEMSLPGFVAQELDAADFVELAAPTPWVILATEQDFFTPDGAKLVYEEARQWYGIYGAEDKVQFFVGPGPHGTPLETRETIYKFMLRWLKDGAGDFREEPVHLYPNLELLVTKSGQIADEPGSRKLHQLILDDFRAKKRQGTTTELQAELRRLRIPSDGSSPDLKVLEETNAQGVRRLSIRFESEPGVDIGGALYVPSSPGRKPAVLLVADGTTITSLAEKFAKAGRIVLELEPRDSPWGYDNRPFIGNWVTNTRADHIGHNLPAMRAHDIVRGVDVLASRNDVDPASIRAAARGVKGIWLLLAAAVDSRISKVWVDRTPYSLLSALERPMNNGLFDAVIPAFALRWDLEDVVKAMGTRAVLWTDPTNWMGKTVAAGPSYRYRFVLGDITERASEQDDAYADELIR